VYKGNSVAVVVPAYNEEELIGLTLAGMPEYVDSIIVTDDASTDDTAARVEAMAQRDARIMLIRHARNEGKGGAVIDGYRRAMDQGHDIVVSMDGDHQMPPEYLPSLLDCLIEQGYDAAKGNRFLAASGTLGRMPKYRLLGNILLTLATKIASGYWSIFDSQNGFWALTATSLAKLDLSRIARRYDLENSLLIHLNIVGARVADVPIPARYGDEVSGIRLWRVTPRILLTLFTGFWRRVFLRYVLYNFHPIALFLFSGLALTLWGVGFGIWVVIGSLGPEAATSGTVMLAVLPFLMGFQLLLAALVLDILSEPK
jgi:glycosyltransferase involved in cell wall biosynthesis